MDNGIHMTMRTVNGVEKEDAQHWRTMLGETHHKNALAMMMVQSTEDSFAKTYPQIFRGSDSKTFSLSTFSLTTQTL